AIAATDGGTQEATGHGANHGTQDMRVVFLDVHLTHALHGAALIAYARTIVAVTGTVTRVAAVAVIRRALLGRATGQDQHAGDGDGRQHTAKRPFLLMCACFHEGYLLLFERRGRCEPPPCHAPASLSATLRAIFASMAR